MSIYTKVLSKDLWKDFETYFEFQGKCSGCWCMNHRLPIGLDFEGEPAKLAMKQLVESNRVFGVLAYTENDKTPIGWASLDQRKTLPGHDCIEEDINCRSSIWSIHCVTVRSDYKNKGVEKTLMSAATNLAKELKAQELEAYPEPNSKSENSFKTWNTFNGFQSDYEDLGFEKIKKEYGEHEKFYFPMKLYLEIEIPLLKTKRLELQPQVVEHADPLFEPFKDKALYQYIKREPLTSAEQLRDGIRSLKNGMLPNRKEYCLNWVLVHKQTKEYIGQVEVSMPVNEKKFYLAYTVFQKYWKSGYAKEACICIINYMFEEWKASKAIIEMDIRNIASIKLAESLGAKRISFKPKAQKLKGEWSDEYVYEIYKPI